MTWKHGARRWIAALITAVSAFGLIVSAPVEVGANTATATGTVNERFNPAIAAARSRLGDPYVWGGSSPGGFDCSGLMYWSFARAGVSLPRTSRAQYSDTMRISRSQLLPGDLVFYGMPVYHVGMYVGDGVMIHSRRTGEPVQYGAIQRIGVTPSAYGRVK